MLLIVASIALMVMIHFISQKVVSCACSSPELLVLIPSGSIDSITPQKVLLQYGDSGDILLMGPSARLIYKEIMPSFQPLSLVTSCHTYMPPKFW